MENELSAVVVEPTYSADFLAFWKAYPSGPRKVNKKGCWEKHWKPKKLDRQRDTIVAHVVWNAKNNPQWRGGFMPMPATYLSQERWLDGTFETEKPKYPRSGAVRSPETDDGPMLSPRAMAANRYFLCVVRSAGGFGEPLLSELVRVKDEIVSEADAGNWAFDEFAEILPATLRKAVESADRQWPGVSREATSNSAD